MPNNYFSQFNDNSPIRKKKTMAPQGKSVPAKQQGKAPKNPPFQEPLKITDHIADKGGPVVKKGTGLNKYHGKIV